MRTFILADNQDITCEGVRSLLESEALALHTVRVSNRAALQSQLRLRPDAAVVLDYTLFDFSSLQQMLVAREAARSSSWLLFSDEPSVWFLRMALSGDPTLSAVFKSDPREEIISALSDVCEGRRYVSPVAAQILEEGIAPPREPDLLTPAERAVLHEIALGKTTKEIAWEKNLSFHTVNSHRKNIFRKLEVNNVHEAIRYALRAGIIDQAEYYI
ncbi:MAG: response regulator transcription factor [Rikenellaceae bacterium]|jgi:DNA-binding NarL/FixJ family response regulator|nr:response regulator transcription factor [Rikenellaceae bacterium]